MSGFTDKIRSEVLIYCNNYKERYGSDFWNDHVRHVAKKAVELAQERGGDEEVAELGALLHDIALAAEKGPREMHHIYGARMAEDMLSDLDYPADRMALVVKCVENHRDNGNALRTTVEEQCVADADVIAHFDHVHYLFAIAYKDLKLPSDEGGRYVMEKMQRDFERLSPQLQADIKERYEAIMMALFGFCPWKR